MMQCIFLSMTPLWLSHHQLFISECYFVWVTGDAHVFKSLETKAFGTQKCLHEVQHWQLLFSCSSWPWPKETLSPHLQIQIGFLYENSVVDCATAIHFEALQMFTGTIQSGCIDLESCNWSGFEIFLKAFFPHMTDMGTLLCILHTLQY